MNHQKRAQRRVSRLTCLGFFAVLSFAACTENLGDSSPAKVLESYVQTSFNATQIADKKKMEELLTGDSKTRLQAWSDEQFMKAFVDSKKVFKGLKVLESKKVSDQEVALTYELSYQEGPADKLAEITERKLCTIIQVDGGWRIKEVRSIRESIEYLRDLPLNL